METAAKDGAAPSSRHEQVRPPIGALPSVVDVLLVGCGPVGATIVNLLARYGVHVLIVDKSTEVSIARQAIELDNDALRILQLAGIREHRAQPEESQIQPKKTTRRGVFVKGRSPTKLVRGAVIGQGRVRGSDGKARPSDEVFGQGLALIGFGTDARASLDFSEAAAFARAGGSTVQIAHRGERPHLARHDSWEDLDGVFLPRLVPVGWAAVVRPDKTVVHDGPATDASRLVRESLSLLGQHCWVMQ
ncbi:FAD-dependent monooxygenase [Paraburkholderia sp. MM5482-R1]|uniref:FAD-dependent monooxygenase n=1 Tax=unclassified Paraburkholderia TaxID=2615204 RepID=UPI003D2205F6